MMHLNFPRIRRRIASALIVAAMLVFQSLLHAAAPLRRPVSPQRPMWIVHIDTWNTPDPERIVEMVPDDIRPYVVFNLSLSATDAVCNDGYAVCDSWLKACAQKRVWAMVQCASGSHSRFSDHDLSVYENYFRRYPNFIGWNFAEQFWGFGEAGQPSFLERLSLFGDILKICHRYGGYLVVSFTQAYYSADMMPIAYMKRNAEVNRLLTEHPEHFICCEKYTMQNGFYDIESNCLGAWLGGYAGQYGIRFDACGWSTDDGDPSTENDQDLEPFVKASGAMPIMEHVMLTGQTVIDGPETIPVEVSREIATTTTDDGYTRRQWAFYPHFININIDEFRKILDGTVRIPTRREVIERTKICLRNDLSTGTFDDYLTPATLYDGLYRSDCDRDREDGVYNNAWLENKWWLKTTGRYPAIPQVYDLLDDDARMLEAVDVSQYQTRWPSEAAKLEEFNRLFPQEYTGDIYAGRHENTWMTYNPYQYEDSRVGGVRARHVSTRRAGGRIPFRYNTAGSIALDFSPYAMAVMKEFADSVSLYMTNYRNSKAWPDNYIEAENATDTIRIYDAVEEPVVAWHDRADHRPSTVAREWKDGVLTLVVSHNGPVELGIRCKGQATDRLTEWTPAAIEVPEAPSVYTGTLQYEAENFDYKDIGACRGNAYSTGRRGYQGQGFVEMGTNSSASIRDTVNVLRGGTYTLVVRYMAPAVGATMQVQVNGRRYPMSFVKTGEVWKEISKEVDLQAGANVVVLKFASTAANILVDCIKLDREDANVYTFEDDPVASGLSDSPAAMLTLLSGQAGVVADGTGNHVLQTDIPAGGMMGHALLELFPADGTDYSVSWLQTGGHAAMLLRGGYLFRTSEGKAGIALVEKTADGNLAAREVLAEAVLQEGFPYLRATVTGDSLHFDASADGDIWSHLVSVADSRIQAGETCLCWEESVCVDQIALKRSGLTLSRTDVEDITQTRGGRNVVAGQFEMTGNDLLGNVRLSLAGDEFEISLDSLDGYADELLVEAARLTEPAEPVRVYVRLKSDAAVGRYEGRLTVSSLYMEERSVNLQGEVVPDEYSAMYDFEDDPVSSVATNPPASGITRGEGNLCTAGVREYTSDGNRTSRMLRIYTAPSANGTGVLDLDRFTRKSTDYSVTWRQVLASDGDYKIGVLLRGDTLTVGNAAQGYTSGMMAGYYVNVYNHGVMTDFRIYKSTSSRSLNMINSSSVSLQAVAGQSIWYRASVKGASRVTVRMEYSLDGENWHEGTTTTDEGGEFRQGATQFVWGLASSQGNFLIDDISFRGVTYDESVATSVVVPSGGGKDILSVEYYDLSGRRIGIPAAHSGVVIRRSVCADGSVRVEKVLFR